MSHLLEDTSSFHDALEHLKSHSDICSKLVRESNIREACELFSHLENIDRLIHEVEDHLTHIDGHIDEAPDACNRCESPLDVVDIKDDAHHTLMDLKDIHQRVEHLMFHTKACTEIVHPNAEEEWESNGKEPIKPQKLIRDIVQRVPSETRFLIDNSNSVPWSIHCFFSQ